jgi:MscS family membrane protein
MRIANRIVTVALMATCWACVAADADDKAHPLAPPDQSSPRATLQNFIALMDRAYARWTSEAGSDEDRIEREAIGRISHRFFDLNDVAPSVRNNVGREAAVYMKEVLDRVELPPWDQIPDAAAVAAMPDGMDRWRIPQTEITLVRLKEGLREGEWVFSDETDERVPQFYELVKQLPYKAGATPGLYQLFVSEPGPLISRALIRALPTWMHTRYGGQALWQWVALVLTLIVTAAAMALIYRFTVRWSSSTRRVAYYLVAVLPIFAVILPQTATEFLSDQVFITGRLFEGLDFALDLVSLGALVVVIISLTNRVAAALMMLSWSKERRLTAQLAQLSVRAIGVTAALIAVFEGGRYLGVPLTTLVAGVSVSGLTVALAAQDTLKNLFGSLMILLDRPFQVGDVIRIKGHEGTVESVGLRSTRIRDANGHLISISNDEMARLDSKNLSSAKQLRRSEVLRLRSNTPPQKVRELAEFIRTILRDRDDADPKSPPSVQVGIAGDAVTVTMAYQSGLADAAAFAAFNESVTLQILDRIQRDGIELAASQGGETGASAASERTAHSRAPAPPHVDHGDHGDHDAGPSHAPEHPAHRTGLHEANDAPRASEIATRET